MKVMISNDSHSAMYYIRLGWARVLTYCGHDVIIWDVRQKSAFDAFDSFNPDLFIGQTYNCDEAVIKCIKERPDMKVIMKGSDWSDFYEDIDLNKYPILTAKEEEKERILRLLEETGKPDYIFVHYMEDRLKQTHGAWVDKGVRVESMLSAADVFEFVHGEERPEYKSDIAFLGGYWPYKAQNLDKYIIPLCNPNKNLNVKIFGNSNWGVSQYCGFAPPSETRHILKSATICPNIHEPHSNEFGFDIVERPFKLLSNECFVISDYVEDLAKLIPKGIVYATCPDDFMDKVEYYLRNPEKRVDFINNGYYDVVDNHTYFNRVHHMLDKLGMKTESEEIIQGRKKFIKEAKLLL